MLKKLKKSIAFLLIMCLFIQGTNCFVFAEDNTSGSSITIDNEDGKNSSENFVIPAGVYFIPVIGEVLVEATGVILVAGVVVAVGSELYNTIVNWLKDAFRNPTSEKVHWDVDDKADIINDVIFSFEDEGSCERIGISKNKSLDENWNILLPYLKETVDEYNSCDEEDNILSVRKYYPEINVTIFIQIDKLSLDYIALPSGCCTGVEDNDHEYYERLKAPEKQEGFKKILSKYTRYKSISDLIVHDRVVTNPTLVTTLPMTSHRFIQFDKYYERVNEFLTVLVCEDYSDHRLNWFDAYACSPSFKIDWMKVDKNKKHHALHGTSGQHEGPWKKFGIDPKKPDDDNWPILLEIIKKTIDEADKVLEPDPKKEGVVFGYVKYFADKGIEVTVTAFQKFGENIINFTDAKPMFK